MFWHLSRKCLPHSLFGDVAFQFLTRRRLINSGLNVFIRFCSGNVYSIIDPEVISSVSGPGMHFPFMIWECLGTMDAYREYNRKVPRAFLDGKTIRPGNDLFHFDPRTLYSIWYYNASIHFVLGRWPFFYPLPHVYRGGPPSLHGPPEKVCTGE